MSHKSYPPYPLLLDSLRTWTDSTPDAVGDVKGIDKKTEPNEIHERHLQAKGGKKTASWVNIHQGRGDLIGVNIQQLPDNFHAAPDYQGKHPAMVIYVFKSFEAHQVEYNIDGTIKSGFWWKINKNHPILKQLTQTPQY